MKIEKDIIGDSAFDLWMDVMPRLAGTFQFLNNPLGIRISEVSFVFIQKGFEEFKVGRVISTSCQVKAANKGH